MSVQSLSEAELYRALVARDPRFDGVFFVGVTSTGVYCRPICRAPKPRAERCRYFGSAAAAEGRGFRPCLRCRPEQAPGRSKCTTGHEAVASVDAVSSLAQRAAARITSGALGEGGIGELAQSLSVSARHLRRAIRQEFGTTPLELALTHRLLLAKRLLSETRLPVIRVAYTSHFRSLRRFNAVFRERYGMTPTQVRRSARVPREPGITSASLDHDGEEISLTLSYRPPYAWSDLAAWLAARATPGVELVEPDGTYRRTVQMGGCRGAIAVAPVPAHRRTSRRQPTNTLRVVLSASLLPVVEPVLARVRRLFDLDADPEIVDDDLRRHELLRALVARRPGLRVPGAFDGFELAVRATVGQQVSVRAATTIAGRLVVLLGEPVASAGRAGTPLDRFGLTPVRVADSRAEFLMSAGLTRSRALCLVALARATADGRLPELEHATAIDAPSAVDRLLGIPGIGPWTASYIAMRAFHWPDAFPSGDLGLRKAAGGITAAQLESLSLAWRPWRAYAAQHLWTNLTDA